MAVLKYNPKPRTEVYRIAVFDSEDHGVAEFATEPGLTLDQRKRACEEFVPAIPGGCTVQIFEGIYTVARTHKGDKRLRWE